jgi:hypothetical protein
LWSGQRDCGTAPGFRGAAPPPLASTRAAPARFRRFRGVAPFLLLDPEAQTRHSSSIRRRTPLSGRVRSPSPGSPQQHTSPSCVFVATPSRGDAFRSAAPPPPPSTRAAPGRFRRFRGAAPLLLLDPEAQPRRSSSIRRRTPSSWRVRSPPPGPPHQSTSSSCVFVATHSRRRAFPSAATPPPASTRAAPARFQRFRGAAPLLLLDPEAQPRRSSSIRRRTPSSWRVRSPSPGPPHQHASPSCVFVATHSRGDAFPSAAPPPPPSTRAAPARFRRFRGAAPLLLLHSEAQTRHSSSVRRRTHAVAPSESCSRRSKRRRHSAPLTPLGRRRRPAEALPEIECAGAPITVRLFGSGPMIQ